MSHDGLVYFALAVELGKVKIGTSRWPDIRIKEIQTCCPALVEYVFFLNGGRPVERHVHHLFRHLRHRGEWFLYTDEIQSFMAAVDAVEASGGDVTAFVLAMGKTKTVVTATMESLS